MRYHLGERLGAHFLGRLLYFTLRIVSGNNRPCVRDLSYIEESCSGDENCQVINKGRKQVLVGTVWSPYPNAALENGHNG